MTTVFAIKLATLEKWPLARGDLKAFIAVVLAAQGIRVGIAHIRNLKIHAVG